MTNNQIFIVIVRPGKKPVTAGIYPGDTLANALSAAELGSADYADWAFTDEDGETLSLDSVFHNSTQVIAGQRVQGA